MLGEGATEAQLAVGAADLPCQIGPLALRVGDVVEVLTEVTNTGILEPNRLTEGQRITVSEFLRPIIGVVEVVPEITEIHGTRPWSRHLVLGVEAPDEAERTSVCVPMSRLVNVGLLPGNTADTYVGFARTVRLLERQTP